MDNSNNKYSIFKEPGQQGLLHEISNGRLIFLICLFIAVLFWVLIKLSDVYTVNYSFNVRYENAPKSLRLTKVIDTTLDLSLTARGFTILKLNMFNDMNILDINLDNYNIDNRGNNQYSIYTQELITKLSDLVDVDEKDINLSKVTLSFEMEKTGERLIPIKVSLDISFANQFDQYTSIEVIPGEVMVYGPSKVLDTLSIITTTPLALRDINSNVSASVALKNPMPQIISMEENIATINFDVEKFTESEISVPINSSNLPFNIKTFPSDTKVYFRVAQKDFKDIKANQFYVILATDNVDVQLANKIPLRVVKFPDIVRNIRIVPSEVEFLIIK